jgi:predicted translin family RNA/ssDNA-binding protein
MRTHRGRRVFYFTNIMNVKIFTSTSYTELEGKINKFFNEFKYEVQIKDIKFTTICNQANQEYHYVMIFFNIKNNMVY